MLHKFYQLHPNQAAARIAYSVQWLG